MKMIGNRIFISLTQELTIQIPNEPREGKGHILLRNYGPFEDQWRIALNHGYIHRIVADLWIPHKRQQILVAQL